MERLGKKVKYTWEANPGQVWEENEFWIELSTRMDPDGSLGIRKHFESPYRDGEIVTVDEYYQWIFENSVPGLPEVAAQKGLSPLEYMKSYGAFEVRAENYVPFANELAGGGTPDEHGNAIVDGQVAGIMHGGKARVGFKTPSKRLEFFSPTVRDWGWPEKRFVIPWSLKSHVHPDHIDLAKGEMLLLPNFRLPTLIHTRSANAKWLYEISHKNPVWMHPSDAKRIGVQTGELIRVETEIGYFVDKVWVTEGIKPGVVAMSHHLGRWRLKESEGVNRQASSLVTLKDNNEGIRSLHILHGATAWDSWDPDTSRIWWKDVGVHQNLTHAVHPDPISGAHCWLQKAINVKKAEPGDRHGDVQVDTNRSMEVYRQWTAMARSATQHSPDGTRRPYWLKRPLKPVPSAYRLPENPFAPELLYPRESGFEDYDA